MIDAILYTLFFLSIAGIVMLLWWMWEGKEE